MTSINELRQRLLHPYYISHFLYGFSLVFYHLLQLINDPSSKDTNRNALSLMAGMAVWKCMMASTAEELASVLILYTKVYSLWNIYCTAGIWRVLLYVVGWITLSTIFPQPWYQGPTNLIELSESMFRTKVCPVKKKYAGSPSSSVSSSTTTSPSASTTTRSTSPSIMPINDIKGPRITELDNDQDTNDNQIKYWVVMLYANWSVACLNFEAVLAKLSLRYDAAHIKFGKLNKRTGLYYMNTKYYFIGWGMRLIGKVDIGIYNDIAQEYGVSIDPASLSLPTLVLFKHGVEIRRLPELTVKEDGSNKNMVKDTITQLGWSKKPVNYYPITEEWEGV
ncbi:hypothetical protein BC941DRAFT_224422 [Chlamydoabsidia padenii]|nr:hypothetical protein BC941DRAFT_224422 [Chlamydoabsidia padenii]